MTALLVYMLGVTFVLWSEDDKKVEWFLFALLWPLYPVSYLVMAVRESRESR